MQIIVANNAGACYGVNRSLEIVMNAVKSCKKIATLGDLIHNPIVIADLDINYNIKSVSSVEAANSLGVDVLVIRSHGVPIDVVEKAESQGIEVIDATCPYVKNVQTTASLLAGLYPAVIIIGKAGHPEVESVSSYIKAQNTKCFVAETKDEIDEFIDELISLKDTVGVVSQTTQSNQVFEDMIEYLKNKGVKLEIENTICAATKKRQQAAIDLSTQVDAMLVVGGKNSSNTNHLADLCREHCKKTFHIESLGDLNTYDLKDVETLGISAGASTPKSHIDSIVETLS